MDNWKTDIAFGGSKYLFKVIVTGFGSIMIQYVEYSSLEKKVVEKYFNTDYENYIQRLFNLSIIKKDKYYDMNNRQTIEQLKLHKINLRIAVLASCRTGGTYMLHVNCTVPARRSP